MSRSRIDFVSDVDRTDPARYVAACGDGNGTLSSSRNVDRARVLELLIVVKPNIKRVAAYGIEFDDRALGPRNKPRDDASGRVRRLCAQ